MMIESEKNNETWWKGKKKQGNMMKNRDKTMKNDETEKKNNEKWWQREKKHTEKLWKIEKHKWRIMKKKEKTMKNVEKERKKQWTMMKNSGKIGTHDEK